MNWSKMLLCGCYYLHRCRRVGMQRLLVVDVRWDGGWGTIAAKLMMNNFSRIMIIAACSLGVAKNIRNILLLLSGHPFVAPNPLNAAMSRSFHRQQFIHTWCIQSSGCSRLKWVVGLISLDTCVFAHVRHKILQSIVSHCRTRKPALCSVDSQRG